MSPLFSFFTDALSAVILAPRKDIHVFSVKDDTEVTGDILNVTFSVGPSDSTVEEYLEPDFVQHKVSLAKMIVIK